MNLNIIKIYLLIILNIKYYIYNIYIFFNKYTTIILLCHLYYISKVLYI